MYVTWFKKKKNKIIYDVFVLVFPLVGLVGWICELVDLWIDWKMSLNKKEGPFLLFNFNI